MKITVLNGNPEVSDYDAKLTAITGDWEKSGHKVRVFDLKKMDIKRCSGCWNCWLKTPGVCVHKDEMETILREIVQSDLLVFGAVLKVGFISAMLKKTIERIIPLALPYIKLYHGECHHYMRYDKQPDFGILFGREKDTDEADIAMLSEYFGRLSLNFTCTTQFISDIENTKSEVINAIVNA